MANVISRAQRSHTVYASAARTATPDTVELELPGGTQYVSAVLDVTAVTSSPDLVLKIEGVDRVSGKVWTLLADASVSTVSTSTLFVGPHLTAAANAVANVAVPPVIRFTVTHGNANSATYTVGAHFS